MREARASLGAKRWVVAAAATSFIAGIGVGLAVPPILAVVAPAEQHDFDERYVRHLTARYGLDREQVQQVRMVLEAKDLEKRRALLHDLEQLPDPLRDAVRRADRVAEERIKYVLTDTQRERFLRDSELPLGGAGAEGSAQRQDK